jgi:hypothetical protein
MICENCQGEVGHLLPVMKEYYDDNGVPLRTGQVFYCLGCVQNLDAEDNTGVPRSK